VLIEFSVANFKSIRERQTLSMVASSAKELASTNTFTPDGNGPTTLRSAVIYGPNAAGKSNLLEAAAFLQNFVVGSAIGQEGQAIAVAPFAFSAATRAQPSAFDLMFMEEGVRYHYGVELTTERIMKEWLVAYPNGKAQRWFEREFDHSTGTYLWNIGSQFRANKGQRSLMQKSTRSNALFLSTAVQLNDDQLRPVFMWFFNKLAIVNSAQGMNGGLTVLSMQDPTKRDLINQIVRAGDVAIEALELKEENLPVAPPGVQIQFQIPPGAIVTQVGSSTKHSRIIALHRQIDSDALLPFELSLESDGTRKLLQYVGGWIAALAEGATLLVDELDGSLHPMLAKFLVSLFHDAGRNRHGAQLIFTTHDTNLLDTSIFRRDQIWFTEKDEGAATKLYPLLDYSPRKDEVLERGYLRGRFGAIPFIGSVNF
jgi:AAA15 family ATPase/GTPase